MKKQQVIMLASRFSAGGHVRTACIAGALAVLMYQIVNTGFSAPVWAASPEASGKHPSLPQADPALRAKVAKTYGQLPLSFEPNRGQTDPQVNYLSRGHGYQIFLTPKETVLSLRKPAVGSPQSAARTPDVLRMKLAGANHSLALEGDEKLPGISNYFIGKDPGKWRTNIPTYRRVVAKQVYPGVDLVYYGQGRQLEYDFIVAPGANPGSIRFALETGDTKRETADWKVESNGDLIVALDGGDVRFHKPVVYQEPSAVGGNRRWIEGRHRLFSDNRVGFELGTYDKSRPIIIDPILSYSTYLGGIELDAANAIAVSNDGSAFIAGETDSVDFPTAHPLQPNAGGPSDFPDDAFIAKISPDGSTLYYSTFLGGSLDDRASGVAVDSFGSAYVTGTTISQDFPTSIGAADPGCGNDARCDSTTNNGFLKSDAFVAKLNPEGSALNYSSFLSHFGAPVLDSNGLPIVDANGVPKGFGANDRGHSIAVGLNGSAYVVGTTDFGSGPFAGVGDDTFLVKVSASGASFLYFADFGGISEDQPYGVALDSLENAHVAGVTYSANFPGCALAGDADAFVMRIDTTQPVAGSLLNSRCLGGAARDQANGIAVDAVNNIYLTGVTNSSNFPTTAGVIKPVCTSEGDIFVTKLTPALAPAYSTCLGGSGADYGASIAVDSLTNSYVTGFTNSSVDFPVPGIPTTTFQEVYGGGNTDAFVVKLNPTAAGLVYATYLGGSNAEDGRGIAVDKNGTAYVTGQTCSTDFPAIRPVQEIPGGNCDAFIAKVQVGSGFSLSTKTLNFGPQAVGTSSSPQSITLSSKGDSAVTITSITATGDFSLTEDCTGAPLAVDASCSINVVFTPSTLDPKSGTITIVSDSLSSPDTVNLTGGGSTGAGGFLLTADPSSQTVAAGSSATFTLTLTPSAGFSGTVNLGCSGVPQQATCTISPSSLTTNGTTSPTAVVTIRTTARVMAPPAPGPGDFFPRNGLRWAPWLAVLLALAMLATTRRKRAALLLAAMMAVMVFWTACGSGGTVANVPRGTPAGSYSITVTATSGSTSQTTAAVLKVN